MQISKRFNFALIANPIAAASTEILSSAVDMAGYRGCGFFCTLGAGSTSGTFKVAQASASSGSWTDVNGASKAIVGADDNNAIVIDIVDPRKRYLRTSFATTAGGGTWDFGGVVAAQYSAGVLPTGSTSMLGVVSVVSAT